MSEYINSSEVEGALLLLLLLSSGRNLAMSTREVILSVLGVAVLLLNEMDADEIEDDDDEEEEEEEEELEEILAVITEVVVVVVNF